MPRAPLTITGGVSSVLMSGQSSCHVSRVTCVMRLCHVYYEAVSRVTCVMRLMLTHVTSRRLMRGLGGAGDVLHNGDKPPIHHTANYDE